MAHTKQPRGGLDLWRAAHKPRRTRREVDLMLAELASRRVDHASREAGHAGRASQGEESAGPSPLEQAREETRRLARRFRRQGVPLAAIGGTHAAGAAAAALSWPGALIPLGLGGGAAAGGYGYAHYRCGRWNRLYAAAAAAGSVSWQVTAAVAGADGVLPGLLWLGGAAAALPYWVRHSEPDPDVTAERAPSLGPHPGPAPPGEQPDPRVVTFGRHLGARGKPLAGSQLSDVCEFAYGWRATVHLPVGEHWTKITHARQAILSVYDLPDGRVCVEPLPGESVRKVRLTVLTVDPLQTTRHWPGPGLNPDTGTFPLMTTADGDTLPFRLWYPGGGACHALVAGATGSGKSACLDLILAELAFSDRYVPWIIDGGEGASNPDWVDSDAVAQAATTPADARRLLRYALTVAKRRKRYLRRTKRRSIDPTPTMPGIAVVIDEAHNLLMGDANADIKRAVEILTQEGRKVAMSVVLATQVPSAAQLGGSTVIRNMLKSGTVVGLRTLEKTAANMAGGDQPLPEPLHQLPAEFPDGQPTRGLGYMLTHRLIRARALYYDPDQWRDTTAPVTGLDDWTAAVEPPQLAGEVDDNPDEGDDLAVALGAGSLGVDPPASGPLRATASTASTASAVSSTDTVQTVRQALDDGTDPDLAALMHATGLPLGAVRRALAHLN